jgi:RNA polymerase sigma factor (sigma-70 family)
VDETSLLASRFQENRSRLHAVAYRMLGSASEADDAVQETWLRLARTQERAEADDEAADIENLAGWLTTVVSRVCLNILRARDNRREDALEAYVPDAAAEPQAGVDPAREAELAESVGLAMLVVLDKLSPAERLAFVLHDMFALPFDDIAPVMDKNVATVRQLASRARRRVRGADLAEQAADVKRQRDVVEAFVAASRGGDFDALVALLDPDVVLRADAAVGPSPTAILLRGATKVAEGASVAAGRVAFSQVALVDGRPGVVMAPYGRLRLVLVFTLDGDRVSEIDVIAEPERLAGIEIAVFED